MERSVLFGQHHYTLRLCLAVGGHHTTTAFYSPVAVAVACDAAFVEFD